MIARKHGVRGLAMAVFVALAAGLGCSDDPPPGVKTTTYDDKRAALMARIAKRKERSATKAKQVEVARTPAPAAPGGFGGVDIAFSYDSENRRDPFRSYEWERPDRADIMSERGPLEQYDLRQLDLVAVVWASGNSRALVQDPSGQSFIVGAGAYIGKNNGRVTVIEDDAVIVKETYVDFLGQETTKDIEMRIRGSEGGEFHVGKR